MSIDPGPAASASAEPLMPEKNVSVRTLVPEAAAHVSDQLGREAKQHLGERPARHQLGRQDEERYREQRKAVDAREHGLHRDHRSIVPCTRIAAMPAITIAKAIGTPRTRPTRKTTISAAFRAPPPRRGTTRPCRTRART